MFFFHFEFVTDSDLTGIMSFLIIIHFCIPGRRREGGSTVYFIAKSSSMWRCNIIRHEVYVYTCMCVYDIIRYVCTR